MARKKGDRIDTRGALLDAAWELFQLHGYDTVSVDAIVRRARLSKGTFFHYFPTKLALLEGVCDHVSGPPWAALSEKVADRTRPAIARFNLLLAGMRSWRLGHLAALADLYRALAREENALLRVKLTARQDELFRRALVDVLEQGARERVFSVPDAEEMARLVGAVVATAGEANLRELAAAAAPDDRALVAALERRADIACSAVERLLAARAGVLERVRASTLRAPLRRARAAAHGRL